MGIKIRQALAGALLCAGTGPALASGFAIIEHSAQGMGNAFSGGGALAEDAGSLYFNPASMSRLGTQLQSSGHVIVPSFEFTDSASTPTGSGADGGTNALVPNLYYVHQLNQQISFGLGINAPFGLATQYDANWIGRYQAVDSEIINLNVNPALAYKVNDKLSLGAGVNINYVDAKLTRAIDFAGACYGSVFTGAVGMGASTAMADAAARADCIGATGGPGSGGNDGFGKVEGDDISFGFNLGLMYELNDNTRVSLAYRSEIRHSLEGNATFSVPTVVSNTAARNAVFQGAFGNDGATAGLDLPVSFSLSGYHRFTDSKFALMADATWTEWSSVPGLLIVYDRSTTTGGPSNLPLGFENTWRLGMGLNYYYNKKLTLRTGFAWDESPVPSAELRSARLPDSDRTWVSFGAGYQFNDRMSADVGYSHLFVDDSRINRVEPASSGTLAGTYESGVDIFSVQFNYQFD
ncbi:MAG: long-chain fatty acid transport protein [Gammaproteobacteria bacterium]|jgi:long-chain fatty acid transport protein